MEESLSDRDFLVTATDHRNIDTPEKKEKRERQ